jgi:hypothetical protein
VQHRPAGHQHREPGRRAHQAGDLRARPQDLLEVVEHQQEAPRPEVLPQPLARRRADASAADQGLRDRGGHLGGLGQRRQRDEARPVRERRPRAARGLDRQPGLPEAAGAGQRHQAHLLPAQQLLQPPHLRLPADERRRREGHVGRPVPLRSRRRCRRRRPRAEPLGEEQYQVVLDEAAELGGRGEGLVRDAVVGPDPVEEGREAGLAVGGRSLEVDQLGPVP